ncbi:MAG: methionyl-tRNA formyltransferase [Alphaproteobacteria bacterium]|nr:methionyl-tRNA formyltransferase [Alphaproteobacteria bacterium]
MRLAFLGTPEFALPAFEALLDAGHEVVRAYAQPPRPAGRGHRLRPSPVQAFAEARGIPVATPASLRDSALQQNFAALGLDAAVTAAYGLLLPSAILAAPRFGCLNLHASLLPRWRGAAPIQHAILAGDRESGISVMVMDEGLDTGPVLLVRRTPIGPGTTGGELHDRLAQIAGEAAVAALAGLENGSLKLAPQPEAGVIWATKIAREDSRLDWTCPAAELERRVRAFAPRPGARFALRGENIRVEAAVVEAGGGPPGRVLDDSAAVACGEGVLRLLRLQRPGRSTMEADAFLRGFPLPAGTDLLDAAIPHPCRV